MSPLEEMSARPFGVKVIDVGVEECEERIEGCVRVRTVGEEAEEFSRSLEHEDGKNNEGTDEENVSDVYKSKPAVSNSVRTSCRRASLTCKGFIN
jgi:hypothetical protein